MICGTEWFRFFDVTQQWINQSQNYSAMAYLPFTLVLTHLSFASSNRQRVSLQSQAMEVSQKLEQSRNVLTSLVSEMTPTARAFCSQPVLVRELLPAVLSVVQPAIRPVNTQLFSAREKAELEKAKRLHKQAQMSSSHKPRARTAHPELYGQPADVALPNPSTRFLFDGQCIFKRKGP